MADGAARRRGDLLAVLGVALAARVAVVAWAWSRFPPVEDGHYYDVLARRLAQGLGYTWLWPDGAVTYAAHYPVGYPALVAIVYGVLGAAPGVAMLLNAVVGAAAAGGAWWLAREGATSRWRPMGAGLAVALHPALVPYTPALMTEGVAAALVVLAAAIAVHARRRPSPWRWLVAAGVLAGVATLVRPQSVLLAPVLGALTVVADPGLRERAIRAALVTAVALACVAPWTARNCVHMHRCALVSVNGGWNLLIGAQTTTGSWDELEVPPDCATVWDEAAKDACFERAARAAIVAAPGAWIARVPAKLATTFDYFGAAPWYLHASDAEAFGDDAKTALATVETIASRLLLVAALVACALAAGPHVGARRALGAAGVVVACMRHGWPAYLALVAVAALLGRRAWTRGPLAVPFGACVIALTALVHAVFFGAGRYGLAVVPFVAILPFATGASAEDPSPRS
ncbi:MAG TPA: glycosyltransferase family 39 protein [Polyangiaceae bacterium]